MRRPVQVTDGLASIDAIQRRVAPITSIMVPSRRFERTMDFFLWPLFSIGLAWSKIGNLQLIIDVFLVPFSHFSMLVFLLMAGHRVIGCAQLVIEYVSFSFVNRSESHSEIMQNSRYCRNNANLKTDDFHFVRLSFFLVQSASK